MEVLLMSPSISLGFIPALCLAFGTYHFIKFLFFDSFVTTGRMWRLVFFPASVVAFVLASLNSVGVRVEANWLTYLAFTVPVWGFWICFWIIANWKNPQAVAMLTDLKKVGILFKFFGFLVLIAVSGVISYLLYINGGLMMEAGPCRSSSGKCIIGEFLLGKRNSLAIWLFFSSLCVSYIASTVTLGLFNQFFNNRFYR
jgi:hypothetical protein